MSADDDGRGPGRPPHPSGHRGARTWSARISEAEWAEVVEAQGGMSRPDWLVSAARRQAAIGIALRVLRREPHAGRAELLTLADLLEASITPAPPAAPRRTPGE